MTNPLKPATVVPAPVPPDQDHNWFEVWSGSSWVGGIGIPLDQDPKEGVRLMLEEWGYEQTKQEAPQPHRRNRIKDALMDTMFAIGFVCLILLMILLIQELSTP